ncbi:MAG: hypothetical protein KKD44_15335 [Proteobacteria bacterium]|nr:hypothetical protein [Pseudomonadota bacterium]
MDRQRHEARPFPYLVFLVFFHMVFSSVLFGALPDIKNDWGGHIKVQGSQLFYDDQSFWGFWGDETGFDTSFDLRLKDTLGFGENLMIETHYDLSGVRGDTYEKTRQIKTMFPDLPSGLLSRDSSSDQVRLFDLSSSIREKGDNALYHRLDRLFLTLKHPWGECRLGRQAVTWGNGMMFNPMDVFNPFSPTDIQRDYKMGDDLVSLSWNTGGFGDIQGLYVPRRNLTTGNVDSNESSWALRNHLFIGEMELDLMGACHYREAIAGIGLSGSLGDTAYRSDLVWSGLRHSEHDQNSYISFVVNLDYSWVWWDKNFYGLVEYYHNGLGHHDTEDSLFDPDLLARITRNELFVLGRHYLGTQLQMEIHPLLSVNVNVIASITEPSAIIQPRLLWNSSQNTSLQWGLTLYRGAHGNEFGGVLIPGTPLYTTSPNSTYVIGSWYF